MCGRGRLARVARPKQYLKGELRTLGRAKTRMAGLSSGFSWRQLEADLSLRLVFRNHEFLDGVDQVLNRGVVGFQAAVQFVYFGGELAVLHQHLPHACEGTNDEDAHLY